MHRLKERSRLLRMKLCQRGFMYAQARLSVLGLFLSGLLGEQSSTRPPDIWEQPPIRVVMLRAPGVLQSVKCTGM